MTVIFYAKGEHPSGFIGYRVSTSVGHGEDRRQNYFALSMYSVEEAYKLAHERNDKLREEAEIVKRKRGLLQGRPKGGAGVLAMGFRAGFKIERGRKSKSYDRPRITPCFIVPNPGHGNGDKKFLTTVHGFDGAFNAAAQHYCELHELEPHEKKIIFSKKPDKELFIYTLRLGLLKKGIIVTAAEIEAKLEIS
ncbi:hypothetical protein ACI2KR_06470 [Pseudomonas luteola]